jgi:hypothetical protein
VPLTGLLLTTLLQTLNNLLKIHFPESPPPPGRKKLFIDMIRELERTGRASYRFTPNNTLNLKKDEINVSSLKRYAASPFPLLTNIESFEHSVGEWQSALGYLVLKPDYF